MLNKQGMRELKYAIFLFFISTGFTALSMGEDSLKVDTTRQLPPVSSEMADMMDSAWVEYKRTLRRKNIEYSHEKDEVVVFPDSVYKKRVEQLNVVTPFDFIWNEKVQNSIHYFTKNRRRFISLCMGRSEMFFPMYEEKLKKYDMPIELKYLSIVESGLRPTAKSRAGATGLWQFMYRTGKMYGLDNNSYVDLRRDPELATEAACKYLSYLHGLYDDWSMALAAYNAGPGNVNKAIRRSGGYMSYWQIRDFLPRETQNYVPSFIATVYMMEYAEEHNIRPAPTRFYDFETDTVCIKKSVHFQHIDSLVGVSEEDMEFLNPIFDGQYIPINDELQFCLRLPVDKIGKFLEWEDTLYALTEELENSDDEDAIIALEKKFYHYVRSGENLGFIAERYGVGVSQIMGWNNLRSTRLDIGQRLIIKSKAKKKSSKKEKKSKKEESPKQEEKKPEKVEQKKDEKKATYMGSVKYYTIKQGDNLWDISQAKNVKLDDIKRLNPGINSADLKVGQRIKIPAP